MGTKDGDEGRMTIVPPSAAELMAAMLRLSSSDLRKIGFTGSARFGATLGRVTVSLSHVSVARQLVVQSVRKA